MASDEQARRNVFVRVAILPLISVARQRGARVRRASP